MNTSSFQTAEVMERGESSGGVGVTIVEHGDYEFDDGGTGRTPTFPLITTWYRMGVSDQLELKGAWSLVSGLEGGAKYRLGGMTGEQGGHLAMGANVRLGGMRVRFDQEEGEPRMSSEWAGMFDAVVPLYLGYRFSSQAAVFVTPQYVFRSVLRMENTYTHMVGGNLGFELGTDNTILFDVMGGYDVKAGAPLVSVGVGTTM